MRVRQRYFAPAAIVLACGGWMPAGAADRYAQVIIRQQVVVRIPAQPVARMSAPATPLREKKGPKCLAMDSIAGAAVMEPRSIDVIVRGGDRYRARFSASCPDLDYYGGFYVTPSKDGKLCADRDVVHARSGGACEIEKFRALVPGGPKKRWSLPSLPSLPFIGRSKPKP